MEIHTPILIPPQYQVPTNNLQYPNKKKIPRLQLHNKMSKMHQTILVEEPGQKFYLYPLLVVLYYVGG